MRADGHLRTARRADGTWRAGGRTLVRTALVAVAATGLGGCALVTLPKAPAVTGPSLAPPGEIGYVVCPRAVTPIELSSGLAEDDIALPLTGTPAPGDFAVATSPDGKWAFVVTTNGVPAAASGSSSPPTTGSPVTTGSPSAPSTAPGPAVGQNVVIPINLATQRAGRPIDIPGSGSTRGIVVMPDDHTVLAASGNTVVPIDATTRQVGSPLDLGAGHTIYGLALGPGGAVLYALVAGGVIPVDTAVATPDAPIPTGLAVSSVYSPHGIAVSANGATVYVIGQGGTDYGGRVVPITAATGALGPSASFDHFGIAAPASIAVSPDGATVYVADSADNWVNQVPVASFANPPAPVRLPAGTTGGTEHPTDIVLNGAGSEAYVVEGFDSVLPYTPASQAFGKPIAVCTGASSMVVAPAP